MRCCAGRHSLPSRPRLIHHRHHQPPRYPLLLDRTIPSRRRSTQRSAAPGQPLEQLGPTVTQRVMPGAQPAEPPQVEVTAAERLLPEVVVDIDPPEVAAEMRCAQPTLYIAAGGVGIGVLCRLREIAAATGKFEDGQPPFESIALDTDRDELREACSRRHTAPLLSEDALHLPLRLPKSYDNSKEILGWLSRRWLYNIPRSLETRGYRPLGRIAVVDNCQRMLALIDRKLQKLAAVAGKNDETGQAHDENVRVVLLAGTGGGTGAGIVIDVANAVRALASTRKLPVDVQGFFVCTCYPNNNASPLVAANTYALLIELSHAALRGNQTSGERGPTNQAFDSAGAPFDCVYCIPARSRGKDDPTTDAVRITAKYLATEQIPEAGAAFPRAALHPRRANKSAAARWCSINWDSARWRIRSCG